MIIKLIPSNSSLRPVYDTKVVDICQKSGRMEKDNCSQLYSSEAPLCTAVTTKLCVIFRNFN